MQAFLRDFKMAANTRMHSPTHSECFNEAIDEDPRVGESAIESDVGLLGVSTIPAVHRCITNIIAWNNFKRVPSPKYELAGHISAVC